MKKIRWLILLFALGYLAYEYLYIPCQLKTVAVTSVSAEVEEQSASVEDNVDVQPEIFTDTVPTTQQVIEARKSIKGHYGLIAIEDTSLNVPVFKGLSDYGMYRGGKTWDSSMRFGVGHTVLFGHNVREQYLFGYITQAKVGKDIYGYDGNKIYVYEVVESRKGTKYEIDYISSGTFGKGKPTLTMVTCVDGFPTEKRWFVRATLSNIVDSSSNLFSQLKEKNGWQ